jgi:predicted GNAT family N-acyltransferase
VCKQLKTQLNNLKIITTRWAEARPQLMAVRTAVFIIEQLVTPEFEWDEKDADAIHLLAIVNNEAVACARIVGNKIQRMAVLENWRGHGVGLAILQKAVDIIQQNDFKLAKLSAQTHAINFYVKGGFVVTSDIYQDLHIPHVDMQKLL